MKEEKEILPKVALKHKFPLPLGLEGMLSYSSINNSMEQRGVLITVYFQYFVVSR